ncbi:MAG: Cell division protein FtsZ [Opitutia bacterium UBA7350]|nr:MAG: Cell division protein FtsZ [Opitutae bacterium UBA7350]
MENVPHNGTELEASIRVRVIGLGGGGSNVLAGIDRDRYPHVEYLAVNTDSQALAHSPLTHKVLLGQNITRGLGAGGDFEIGRQVVEADRAELEALVAEVDLLILVTGLGGGTGTAAALLLAELATQTEATVLAFTTQPFTFEGARRREISDAALADLREKVHGLIPVPNDLLLQETEEDDTALSAFAVADKWIGKGIHSLCAMLFETGIINQDFSALRNLLQRRGGKTIFAIGAGKDEDFVKDALSQLCDCPLLHATERPSRMDRILLHLVVGSEMGLAKIQEVVTSISEQFDSSKEIIVGAVMDSRFAKSLEICLIAKVEIEPTATTSDNAGLRNGREPMETIGSLGLENANMEANPKPVVHVSKLIGKKKKEANEDQDEFLFVDLEAQRGYFEQTDQNLYNNEDLDVPTFLRRGIKIKLK